MEAYKDVIEVLVGIVTIVGAIFGGWRWFAWLRNRDERKIEEARRQTALEIAKIYTDGMKQVVEAIERKSVADQANIDRHNRNEQEIRFLKDEHEDFQKTLTDIKDQMHETGSYVKMLVDKMIPGAKIDERRAKE